MDFRNAVDRLTAGCASRDDIAEALGASFYSIKQALLDPSSSSHRAPPPDWEKNLAKLARKRGGELVKLAELLEKES